MMLRPLCLAPLTVLDISPLEQIIVAADAGYTHIGLRLIPATDNEPVYPLITTPSLLNQLAQQLTLSGIQVLDIEVLRLKPETQVTAFLPILEIGARLGASDILITGNDPDENRLRNNFSQLCELAYPFGLHLNLEPTPWTDVPDIRTAVQILQHTNQPNQALLVDPLHFYRADNHLDQLTALPASYFRYMQICDGPKEKPITHDALIYQARNARLSPGKGDLDLLGLLHALPILPLSIECANTELAKQLSPLARAKMYLEDTQRVLMAQEKASSELAHKKYNAG